MVSHAHGAEVHLPALSPPAGVAITGLRSDLGARLAKRLVSASAPPRVLGLDHRRPARIDPGLSFEKVDLCDPTADEALARVLERQRVEVLVHTAFRKDPGAAREADHELDTIGSLHVMNACAAARVRRLVVLSSTMLYGPHPDNPNFLTESHPLRGHPHAHAVRDRIEMEHLLADWSKQHPDVEVTVLRAGWTVGPSSWNDVLRALSLPVVALPLGYDPLLQLVHEDDLLHALECATLESHPGVFNVVAPGPIPVSTLMRLADQRSIGLPGWLLDRVAYGPMRAQSGDPASAFYDYLRYLWVADGARATEAFGAPAYTTQEAWMSFVSARRMQRYR